MIRIGVWNWKACLYIVSGGAGLSPSPHFFLARSRFRPIVAVNCANHSHQSSHYASRPAVYKPGKS
jgi:hypothetical protein